MWSSVCFLPIAIICLTSRSAWGWWRARESLSVCYEEWGCFSILPPFSNTGHLPVEPDRLGVQFFLYTRQHQPPAPEKLELDWSDERMGEVINVTKDTRVIVHGYLDNGHRPWVHTMVEALLERADQNVLVIDWARGARSSNYLQVAANTRLVGKMVAAMLHRWVRMGAQPSSFHLIGASLGAHIAGYVGSDLQGIGRITGLDPAGPSFENTAPEVRLDPEDAIFVDVIHTNAMPIYRFGLGYNRPCGTVDFYPNGGRHQPGCHRSLLRRLFGLLDGEDAREMMGCSHLRAVDLFISSIGAPCAMAATPCAFPRVLRGPSSCRRALRHCRHCVTMGYDVEPHASGVFYASTGPYPPYCTPVTSNRETHDGLPVIS